MKIIKATNSLTKFVIISSICLTLIACTPTKNTNKNLPNNKQQVAGFFDGCWHGSILPVTFVYALFNQDVNVYETHNNGNWYNFGFLLGIGGLLGVRFSVWGRKSIISINLFADNSPDFSDLIESETKFKQK